MSIVKLSIKRPVFAWMLMAALIIFGAISLNRLGISHMPDVDFPVLSVSVSWEGAAPEVVETEIVDRLEDAIISLEGIREISSNIRQGQANISIEFDLERDIDAALQEVQSAVSRIRMPLEVDPPTIRKSNPEDQPIIWLGISGQRSLPELIRFVELNIKDRFQTISGVGEVFLAGYTERNLRIWVDNQKLNDLELTIIDVVNAVKAGQIEAAAGRIENSKQELNLRIMGEGISAEEVGEIILNTRGGRPIFNSDIKLKNIAKIESGLADIRRVSRVDGVPAVGIGIRKQRGANTVAVGEKVKERLSEVQSTLPGDLKIGINFDSTIFVEESVAESEFTLLLSVLVTGVICLLFLGALSPTINVLLSIPTSIFGTLAVIYFMGFTLNFFTILGLALAVGIVVDDAIMVLENIYRHFAKGKDRALAALQGTEEIMFAALAATIAVIAIFLPIAFMDGVIGKYFFQFGVTITAAVAFSLLEAITLTPMRCAQFMPTKQSAGRFFKLVEQTFSSCATFYGRILERCLRWSYLVIITATIIFALSLTLVPKLRKEFIPPQDQSQFIIRAQTPVGSSLEFTQTQIAIVEDYLKNRSDITRVFAAIGGMGGGEVNSANIFVTLKSPAERKLIQTEIMNEVRQYFKNHPTLKVFPQDLSTRGFTAQRGFPVEFNIRGPDWAELYQHTQKILAKLESSGKLVDLDTDYRLGQPEIRIWPNRELAAKHGVTIEHINQTVAAAIGGIREGKITSDGRRYDVRIALDLMQKTNPDDILNLQIRNIHGELIPIKDLVRLEQIPTLQTITRKNRERSISVYANLAEGQSQAQALEYVKETAKDILPANYKVFLSGGAQTFLESFNSLIFVMWLGVLVAYMVLAAQFNSFIHPFTVLLALPFSLTGALLALYLSNQSINLFSMIGIVLLLGIVKKNSILLVEFINHKREVDKLPLEQALLEAAPIRLRPILMTSCATIAAALPPALAFGPGAESRIPMSVTIVGGVLVSTIFTLIVVPCAYKILSRLEAKN